MIKINIRMNSDGEIERIGEFITFDSDDGTVEILPTSSTDSRVKDYISKNGFSLVDVADAIRDLPSGEEVKGATQKKRGEILATLVELMKGEGYEV